MSFLSSRRRGLVSAIVALAVSTAALPSAVFAADPTPADKASARDAYAAGTDLRAKGDNKGALEKFKAAYGLVPSPITALEFGRSLVDVGQLVEGYEKLLEAASMPAKPNESADAKKARVDAKTLADSVEQRIPTIVIKITGAPDDASVAVTVDDHAIAPAAVGLPFKVNPGTHHVVAKVDGKDGRTVTVTLKEGESRDVEVRPPAAPTKERGRETRATSEPKKSREAPQVEGSVSPWAYVGFTVAGVGAVVGGITGVMASSKGSAIAGSSNYTCDGTRCPPEAQNDISSYNTLRYTSFAAFGVAGVGLCVGIVALATGGSGQERKASASVAPWIGLGSVGLRGEF